MTARLEPLPASLGEVFRVSRAKELGIAEGRLRAADLGRPWRGTRCRDSDPVLVQRLRALSLVLPEAAVLSHETAARLLQLPFPVNAPRDRDGDAVHVTTPRGSPRVVRAGVVGHRGTPCEVVTVRGLRVTGPAATLIDLAATWTLDDLVAVGDTVLRRGDDDPGERVTRLAHSIEGAVNRRGIRVLRRALPLMRVGSRSAMETRARLIMGRGGLPEPELNVDILDPRTGEWLATPDFVWRRQRVVAEFQGDHHRTDRAQWQSDIARMRRVQEAGWRYVPLAADDALVHPDRLVAAVAAALFR